MDRSCLKDEYNLIKYLICISIEKYNRTKTEKVAAAATEV